MTSVRDIPVANTPTGGYGDHNLDRYDRRFPEPVLADCDEPLIDGVGRPVITNEAIRLLPSDPLT